ncbi:alpha/beta hydrolase [Streptomyces apocyni]|uniref:alpha/beta hydrolase n=1 Tax=Streptomyces apocyni TaxID=2654677 RepID=UPI0012EAEA2F|nr:alpha/beta hydrolase [Streptomyces apocyni]
MSKHGKRGRAPLLYAVTGSLVLTGLAASPASPAASASSTPEAPEARGTRVAVARAEAAGISFGRCPEVERLPAAVQCGTVTVPLDYADPDGKQIKLTVSRVKAKDPAKRQGALIFNPGGPGGSGMYFPVVSTAGLPAFRRIAREYDVVGYAPRGVGRSAPVSCKDPATFDPAPTRSPRHPDAAYKQERVARAKTYARGCLNRTGEALRHYHSLNNARDLDVLRAGLGERKLNFLGASYGTYFGALYAAMFPSHVRRMVFDSAVNPDPSQIWYQNNLDQSLAFERRWADFRAWVAAHHTTYGLGRTPQQVAHSYEKVRAALAREPAGGKVGTGELQAAFLQTGYHDDVWPKRAAALTAYLNGDPKPLVQQAARSSERAAENENGNAVYTAVECNDAPWPTDFETWDEDNSRLARVAPFETWDNAWMNLPCAYWPVPRQRPLDLRIPDGALPPTLILAAERDAATPYQGAWELHRRLPDSALVTERKAGTHGLVGGPNQCVNGHLEAYLLDGRLPARRAAGCAPRPEPKPEGEPEAAGSREATRTPRTA